MDGNRVADVGKSGDVDQKSFKPEPKTSVRNRAVATEIEIPLIRCHVRLVVFHPRFQNVESFFAL